MADADIVLGEAGDLVEAGFVGGIVAEPRRDHDVLCRRFGGGAQPLQRAIDLARRDRETDFPRLDPHVRQIFGGTQRLDGGELLGVGGGALARGEAIADLLLGEHAGDQQHAEAGPDSKLRANTKIEARHRLITHNGPSIDAGG